MGTVLYLQVQPDITERTPVEDQLTHDADSSFFLRLREITYSLLWKNLKITKYLLFLHYF